MRKKPAAKPRPRPARPKKAQPEKTCIYALVCPLSRRVRYVGKANNPEARYNGHLSERNLRKNTAKNRWLKSLLSQDLKPILVILQVVDQEDWANAERAWIAFFRMSGCRLTNVSDGGEGGRDPGNHIPED